MTKELPKRSEVNIEDTWNLADMYETVEDWEADLKEIAEITDIEASYEGKVTASAKNLLAVLENDAKAGEKLDLAFNYAQRLFDEDQSNNAHQAMSGKVFSLYTDVLSKTAFIKPEILAADSDTLEGFFKELPQLEHYRKQIEEIQRTKAHSLSAEMEKLLAMSNDMSQTAGDTFSIFNESIRDSGARNTSRR